jgi:hypothetical protein
MADELGDEPGDAPGEATTPGVGPVGMITRGRYQPVGQGGDGHRVDLWLPVDRARHARALLVGSGGLDAGKSRAASMVAAAKALVDGYMLGAADFPSPTAEDIEPGSADFVQLQGVADAIDRALLVSDEEGVEDVDLQAFAEVSVLARRPLATADPAGQGALFGLALTVLAHAQNAAGRYEMARASAYEATRVLGQVASSELARVQPSLVLALDAATFADLALGRRSEALSRVQRSVFVLRQLAAHDELFVEDLEFQLVMLASIHSELGQDDEASAAVAELADLQGGPPKPDDEAPAAQGPAGSGSPAPFTAAGRADDLYQEGLRLAREGQHAQSETYLANAVAAYRRVPMPAGPELGRRLATTLWRQSMVLHTLERRMQAMAAGDEAVTLWRGLLETSFDDDEQLELLAELTRACTDLSVVAGSAGLREEPVRLAKEAVERARSLAEQNPSALPYLSTALHNLAVAHASREDVGAAIDAVSEAVDLRQQLATGDDPTNHELANSQLLCGQLLVQAGNIEAGAQHMADALLLAVELLEADELVARCIGAVRATDELLPGVFETLEVTPWLTEDNPTLDDDVVEPEDPDHPET